MQYARASFVSTEDLRTHHIRIRDNGSIPITANPFAEFSQQTLRIVVFRNGFEFMVNRNESLA